MVFPSQDPELVLVGNRAALVRVNLVAASATTTKPSGVLRVDDANGTLLRELPLAAPTGNLPTSAPTTPSFADSYSVTLPPDLVRSGIRITARFSPAASNAPTLTPRVGGGVAITWTAVPVQIGSTVGQAVTGADAYVRLRLPVAQVTRRDHPVMVSSSVTALPVTDTEWSTAFSRILNELDDLHLLENASSRSYYYGFIPKRSFGLSGMGYRPGNAAVGFDVPSSPNAVKETLLHELGHNLSLQHAPCGGPSSPDPSYPYANATLGAGTRFIWGYDADAARFIDPRPTTVHDLMSYCAGSWFSDYNYRKVQVYLTPADRTLLASASTETALAAPAAQDLLVVSGEVDAQGIVKLNPLKHASGQPRAPAAGPYLLRITTQQGATIEQRFATREVDHLPQQRFGFTLAHPGAIAKVEVLLDGRVLTQREQRQRALAAGAAEPQPAVQASEEGGVLRLTWDAARWPYLSVTHVGGARTTLAIDAQGGRAMLPLTGVAAGGHFEFSLSDGLDTRRVVQPR